MKKGQLDLSELRRTLPPFIARKKFEQYLGGIFSVSYMQNLDSRGEGPPKIKIGRNVGYLRDSLIDWLEARMEQ